MKPISLITIILCFPLAASAQDETTPPEPPQPEIIEHAAFLPNNNLITFGRLLEDVEPVCHGTFNGDIMSLWDHKSGKRITQWFFAADVEEVEISPDGKRVASWNTEECDHFADGAVRLYRIENVESFGSPTGTLGGPNANVIDVCFTPDAKRLAVSYDYHFYSEDKSAQPPPAMRKAIRVWDLETFSEYCWLTAEGNLLGLVISPNGRYLAGKAYGEAGEFVYVWDLEAKKKLARLPAGEENSGIGITADSRQLVMQVKGQIEAYDISDAGVVKAPRASAKAVDVLPLDYLRVRFPNGAGKVEIVQMEVEEPVQAITLDAQKQKQLKKYILDPDYDAVDLSHDRKLALIGNALVETSSGNIRPLNLLLPSAEELRKRRGAEEPIPHLKNENDQPD